MRSNKHIDSPAFKTSPCHVWNFGPHPSGHHAPHRTQRFRHPQRLQPALKEDEGSRQLGAVNEAVLF